MSRRRGYRGRAQRSADRFTDMMEAVISGGSRKCHGCGLLRPAQRLNEKGVCGSCTTAFGRVRGNTPRPTTALVTLIEPGVVYTDASFRDGLAGLGVVGALGEHRRKIEAASSVQAEVLALRWAMEIARSGAIRDLVFRTDCQAAYNLNRETGKRLGWIVEQVPRRLNQHADRLAGDARINGGVR